MPLTNDDAAYLAEKLRKKIAANKGVAPDARGSDFIPAQIPGPDISEVNWVHLERTVRKAEPLSIVWHTRTEVGHYPWFVRPFAAIVGKVFLFLGQVITKPQQAFNTAVMENLNALRESMQPLQSSVFSIASRFETLNGILASYEKRQTLLTKHIEYLELLLDRVPILEQELKGVTAKVTVIEGLSKSVAELAQSLTGVEAHSLERYEASLAHANQIMSRLAPSAELSARVPVLEKNMQEFQARIASLLGGVHEQERRLAVLIEEANRRMPEAFSKEDIARLAALKNNTHDSFYLEFENRFRGTREEILGRVSEYLPDVKAVASKEFPVVDVGCGRGEWLEFLRSNNVPGIGIDSNTSMVTECKTTGLDVLEGDAVEGLRALKDESIGVVTGFHIVEHLPFEVMIKLFDETRRVLKKGGIAIFETPNPENVIVGSNTFYLDPTHLHPLPPAFLKFVAEQRGFANVELRFLHPVETSQLLSENTPTSNRFNHFFYGPRDYAVIARKV